MSPTLSGVCLVSSSLLSASPSLFKTEIFGRHQFGIMLRLVDLHSDVLDEILSYLESDKHSLCQLAMVSSLCSEITRPHLYRDIEFTIAHGPRWFRRRNPLFRHRLFMESMTKRPSLGALVRTVSLNTQGTAHSLINDILEKLPAVREVALSETNPYCQHAYVPTFFARNPMPQLRQVELNIGCFQGVTLHAFMCRGEIEGISVASPTSGVAPMFWDGERQASPLRSLETDFPVSQRVLYEILCWTPMLTTLECQVPFARERCDVLSRAGVVKALAPVMHSLKELVLRNWYYSPLGDDTTWMDFQDFKCLRVLQVPWTGLCHRKRPGEDPIGIYKLFPASLEELTVSARPVVQAP